MSAIPEISAPPPSLPIPDWRRVEHGHPSSSQIGVHFSDWGSIGVGLKRNIAALCLYLQPSTPPPTPYVDPIPPKVTQSQGPRHARFFAWWGGRHPRIGRGSQPQKDKTQRNPRCGFCSSQHQVPTTKYLLIAILLHPSCSVTRELVHTGHVFCDPLLKLGSCPTGRYLNRSLGEISSSVISTHVLSPSKASASSRAKYLNWSVP
jgi:hypothetical protein